MAKVQMALCLFLIALTAVVFTHQISAIFVIVIALVTTFTTDFILVRLRRLPSFPLYASLVTGLIIGLLTSYFLPWYAAVLAGVLAIISKNFIRFNNRHIFNPAGFGLLAASLILGKDISWWGVSFQTIRPDLLSIVFVIILLSPGIVSIFIMQRYRIFLSFWLTYLIILIVLGIGVTFDPTVVFFSLVMLPEPMTTPNYPRRQFIFGPFVAIASFLSGSVVFGLLLGNLVFYLLNLFINHFTIKR